MINPEEELMRRLHSNLTPRSPQAPGPTGCSWISDLRWLSVSEEVLVYVVLVVVVEVVVVEVVVGLIWRQNT